MDDQLLPRRGWLWAWTTQEFPPPSPPYAGPTGDAFVPFGVGYVELDGEVKVETRLTEADPEALSIGMEMELVVLPFRTDDDGNEVVTFAFRPVGWRDASSPAGARERGQHMDAAIVGVG